MRSLRRVLVLPATAMLAVALAACGGGGDDADDTTTTSTTSSSTTTTAAPASTTTSTTARPAPSTTVAPTTTAAPLVPGDPCAVASDPDCIDPSGAGQGTYLEGGADCLATFPDNPGLCADLDGDGFAGYPDSG